MTCFHFTPLYFSLKSKVYFILILLFALLAMQTSGQISIDTTHKMIYDSTSNSYYDISRIIMQVEASHELQYDTITASEFYKYASRYTSGMDTPQYGVEVTDTTLCIRTKQSTLTLNAAVTEEENFNYYLGFLSPLNLHFVHSVDGRNEMASLLLIDHITGEIFELSSPYDHPYDPPFLSSKQKFLLAYSDNFYEDNQCTISIYKVVKKKKHFTLESLLWTEVNDWMVYECAWIDERHFALHAKTRLNANTDYAAEKELYLKATLPENE